LGREKGKKEMAYSKAEIEQKLENRLIGKRQMQEAVISALTLLPNDLADQVTKTVWFVSNFDDAWGFTLDSKDLGQRHLVFLSDELFFEPRQQVYYTILHELGHVVLGHRNAFFKPQTRQETEKQEYEADKFARKHLKS